MKFPLAPRLRLIGTGLALTASALCAWAQAPAAPAPAPAWKQGMPDSMSTSTLAPHAAKLTATKASDIDLSRFKLPAGFKVEVWADSVPGVRAIARGDNGKYYAGTRPLGRVYEITDNGGQRSARVLVEAQTALVQFSVRGGEVSELVL